jgi:hypothetical protein
MALAHAAVNKNHHIGERKFPRHYILCFSSPFTLLKRDVFRLVSEQVVANQLDQARGGSLKS